MRYSALTRRYFEAAPCAGTLEGPGILSGAAGSRSLGTWVRFDLRVAGAANRPAVIVEARFLAFGCPHTIAVAAWVAEQAAGHPVSAELPQPVDALRRSFDVPVEKLGRLLVVEDAWRAAAARK
ncbi:MAG: iron-sulfur cluster assembly scaffold protein [Gammaproteobacteria bacterium]|nr:iron-sulfur cluster assembly scaffold protein [Gammaproteobacteria bacterium]